MIAKTNCWITCRVYVRDLEIRIEDREDLDHLEPFVLDMDYWDGAHDPEIEEVVSVEQIDLVKVLK